MTHLLYSASLSDAMNASAAEVGLLVPKDPEAPTSLLEYLESGTEHLFDSFAAHIRKFSEDIRELSETFKEYAMTTGEAGVHEVGARLKSFLRYAYR